MHPKYNLKNPLKDLGLKGDSINDDRVWIVNTHFPILSEYKYDCSRVVLGVRNPLDVFDSFFNIAMTNSHSETIAPNEYEVYKDVFEDFVQR